MAKRCAKCGEENPDWASFCQRCGEYFPGTPAPGAGAAPAPGGAAPGAPMPAPGYGYPTAPAAEARPLLGATIVLVLAGIDTVAATLVAVYLQVTGAITPPADVNPALVVLSYIGLVMIPLPIVAGLLAHKRSAWGIAVGCAALGILTAVNSFFYESGLLSLVGLILIVRRRSLFIS